MTQRILVIEGNSDLIASIKSTLLMANYEVLVARDVAEGMRLCIEESPNLILVNKSLPGSDGDELVRFIRVDPALMQLPVIMLISEDYLNELLLGNEAWVDDYLILPFSSNELLSSVQSMLENSFTKKSVICSGNGELDDKMGGGLPVNSLTLIEGSSGSGKSVLTQQIIWGSLNDNFTLTVFTSENTVKSLVTQMESLDLDILDFLLLGKLRVYPMALARLGPEAPYALLDAMYQNRKYDILVIDSLTSVITWSSAEEIISFFERAKQLCARGTTVILVLHSHVLSSEKLAPVRSLCDAHLQLRADQDGQRLVKTLEVAKVRGAGSVTGNIVSFEVEPGWGMRVIPISKARG